MARICWETSGTADLTHTVPQRADKYAPAENKILARHKFANEKKQYLDSILGHISPHI
jgi:hypothetical protein